MASNTASNRSEGSPIDAPEKSSIMRPTTTTAEKLLWYLRYRAHARLVGSDEVCGEELLDDSNWVCNREEPSPGNATPEHLQPKSPSKTELTSFTLFPKLPIELRFIIYHLVADEPRLLDLRTPARQLPPFFLVSKEAHEETTKHLRWIKRFESGVDGEMMPLPNNLGSYINPASDVLYVSRPESLAGLNAPGLRTLALVVPEIWRYLNLTDGGPTELSRMLHSLPDLQLVLVIRQIFHMKIGKEDSVFRKRSLREPKMERDLSGFFNTMNGDVSDMLTMLSFEKYGFEQLKKVIMSKFNVDIETTDSEFEGCGMGDFQVAHKLFQWMSPDLVIGLLKECLTKTNNEFCPDTKLEFRVVFDQNEKAG